MGTAKNKHRNIRKGGHVKTVRYHDLLRAKRTQNPLSGLNPAKVRRLYELYREGKYADVQLAWDALEEYDDMLGTVLERRQSALGEMEWDVLVDARAVGEDAALQALAEAQQDYITRRLREVENLSAAIKWLGLADFRRYAALEVLPMATGERWLPIHHWHLCRPALEGTWCYNEAAETSCARVEPIDMSAVILREVARPIDLVAMFLISAKEAAIDGWDSFLEVFGNPALFFKMPPGTSDDQRDEYASIIKEISSDGAGVYPDGGEIHTVETSAANADAFSSRAEWCDKALVRRATGGLLTVLAESGSGTLAGSAHMEAFRQIAANDAISIAECINRQYVRRRIAAQFPGEPVLVYFKLTPPVINDRAATVQMLCQLAGQRWRATDEAVSEEVGMEVHTEAQNAPQPTGASPQPEALANRSSEQQSAEDSPGEAPLSEGELAALRALGGELNPDQIAADAEYMTREMLAGLREPLTNRGEGGHVCKATKRACPLAAVENLAESCKQGYVRPARHESEKARREYQAEVEQAAVAGKLSVKSKATGQPLAFTGKTVEHLRLQDEQEFNKRMNNVGNFLATAHDPDYVLEHKNGKELERVYLRTMTDESGKKGQRGREHYYCVVEKATSMPGQMHTAYEVDDYGRYTKKIKPREITYRKPQK